MKKSIFATIAIPALCACLNPVFAESSTSATMETTAKAAAITDSEIAGLASGYLGYAGTSEPRRSELTAHAREAELDRDSLANTEPTPENMHISAVYSADPSSVLF